MHDTAHTIGQIFFGTYVAPGSRVLDIGSMNINGTLRDFQPVGCSYVGVDLGPGKGVDVVVSRISQLPFRSESFDVIVSTSCFEHDAMFWQTFIEMCRVLRPSGYIYLNVPSKGSLHQYPIDAWRFFPDSGIALQDWAQINKYDINLLESFITLNLSDIWNDCAMVFTKGGGPPSVFISEKYSMAINVRRWPDLKTIYRTQPNW